MAIVIEGIEKADNYSLLMMTQWPVVMVSNGSRLCTLQAIT